MLKYSEDLRELEKECTENLRVNLFIEEIAFGMSPKCPRLSTLVLSYTPLIPDSFFINMSSLKVLNLSQHEDIQHLPGSISHLVSLTVLLLHGCSSLNNVPSLANLQKLERLDFSWTGITELPPGLDLLINLRWLHLRGTRKLTMSPASVIPKLTNLQVLVLEPMNEWLNVKAADLEDLKVLESISVSFNDKSEFNTYIREVVNAQNRVVKNYYLSLTKEVLENDWSDIDSSTDIAYGSNKATIMFVGIENAASLFLPVDMNELIIEKCDEWRSLCNVLSFDEQNNAKSPKFSSCTIEFCSELENVFCLSGLCSFCSAIRGIESLSLDCLDDLSMLCNETNVAIGLPPGPFSSLRSLGVSGCNLLKTLLTPGMIGDLQNLETLYVFLCKAMEEIFSSEKNNVYYY